MDKIIDPLNDPAIESHTKAFLKILNSGDGKPMEQLAPADARKVLEDAQRSVTVDVSGIVITPRMVNGVQIYIVRPEGQTGVLPAFMFFHGGGWMLGDFATHKRFVRDLVVYSGAAAVFVEYSRSPEAKYPTALNECYAVTQWIAEHGAEVDIDGKRIAVVGNSAGGNLAAATALMAKDKKGPEIKFQLLFWPVTYPNFETESYHQYASSRFLTRNMMTWFWDSYVEQGARRNEVYAAPLTASPDQLKGLPSTLVQTAENDVLRDEGEAYARKMDSAGVPVTLMRVQGMIHDYGLLNPLAEVPAVQSALRAAATELKKALA
ncbi:alpha/beta hydrolase [Chitinophaga niabensis]|uniref:alpha/beta hydrolase n=1 Tax=Chitinophaga niabensis TaxID=536979 RepID=UPI0031BBA11B